MPSITNDYNYDSKVPTCICSGDQDPSYPNNVTLFNNLTDEDFIAIHNAGQLKNIDLDKLTNIAKSWQTKIKTT